MFIGKNHANKIDSNGSSDCHCNRANRNSNVPSLVGNPHTTGQAAAEIHEFRGFVAAPLYIQVNNQ